MNGHVGCLIKMSNKYCVFGCNSNYVTTEERFSVFSFPKDTDNLESRFGLYRQLSGSNYLVSVKEVMQSERKLKILILILSHHIVYT